MASLDVLLLTDGRNTTGGEASGAGADEFGELAAELEFGFCANEAQFGLEEVVCFRQIFKGVPAKLSASYLRQKYWLCLTPQ